MISTYIPNIAVHLYFKYSDNILTYLNSGLKLKSIHTDKLWDFMFVSGTQYCTRLRVFVLQKPWSIPCLRVKSSKSCR